MPRVIFKCPHLKAGRNPSGSDATAEHRRTYVKYIATRSGVEKMDETRKLLPTTQNQQRLIAQLLREFPDTTEMFEYEDYLQSPTRGNASALITAVFDHNLHLIDRRENYVNYIATRPRAERTGTHGLFTSAGKPVVLAQIADEAAEHPGTVWLPIISLRREDAARLGYDNAQSWQAFISSYMEQMAAHMKIHPDNFQWYAAYHDEGHHPHVHMVCWSTDPGEGFLTVDGIRGIKSGLAGGIFRQELTEVYQKQTEYRNELMRLSQQRMAKLTEEMRCGTLHNDNIEQLTTYLAQSLRRTSGKKQYGYLKAPLKSVVDEIVNELAKDARVAEAYRLWCDMRLDVLQTYIKDPSHPGALANQKELKRIRNIVIEEAVKLGEQEFTYDTHSTVDEFFAQALADVDATDSPAMAPEGDDDIPEPHLPEQESLAPRVDWSNEYRQAKEFLYGSEEIPRDFERAFQLFHQEALGGNALAMHDLARMYADGLGREPDPAAAHDWYTKALTAFLAVEDEKQGRYTEYRIGKMYAAGLGTEQDCCEAANWFRESADKGYKYAQYSLGGLYYHGKGVEQDRGAAHNLYTKSAAQGFPYASFELGKMYRDGVGTAKDAAAADSHFRNAYDGFRSLERQSHDDRLQYRLGWMLENGVGTKQDIPAALDFYERSAGVGNPHAQYAWAKLILKDETASQEQASQAVKLLHKAVEAGNGAAVYALAKLYRDGSEHGAVEKDIPRAVALFERAAVEFENEYAAYALGKLYQDGTELVQDIPAAVRWLEMAAEAGNQFAQYQLGKLYLSGDGISKDIQKSVRWLSAASEQGNQYAQYTLGMLYLKGEDVPKNVSAAAALLEQAARQDNEYAAYQLGKLHLSGDGIPKDVDAAVRWYTAAAEAGNQFAQYQLGKLYLMGKEVPRDRESALSWLTLSAVQGNEYAQFFLDRFDQWQDPSAFSVASRLLHHMAGIFRDTTPPPSGAGGIILDRKLLRKLKEKKIAQGHAEDDHAPSLELRM